MDALQHFALQVEGMRDAQKRYFKEMKEAKKSGDQSALKSALDTLARSKQLEKEIDDSVQKIKAQCVAATT